MKKEIHYFKKDAVIEELKKMEKGIAFYPGCGICYNLMMKTDVTLSFLIEKENINLEEFEFYSGNPEYPISDLDLGCIDAYLESGIPKWTGPYGERRKAFCSFLIKKLESSNKETP